MNTMIPKGVFILPKKPSRRGPSATYKNLLEGAYTDDIHPNTHPVRYTIFTDDIIPPKRKSRLWTTTQQNLKQLITFIHENNIDIMNQKAESQTVQTDCVEVDTLVPSGPSS